MTRIILWVSVLTLATASCAVAQLTSMDIARDTFRQANAEFDAAIAPETDPESRVSGLERSIDGWMRTMELAGIENGRLYYNIGNAYMMLGDHGRAILSYRRAQRYIGSDDDVCERQLQLRDRAAGHLPRSRPRP